MTMLHLLRPASRHALEATQLAIHLSSKTTASELAAEHEAAAEAHRAAAREETPLRVMHEKHAGIHAQAAECLRQITGQ